VIKREAAPNTPSNDGAKMFKTYCASCHGLSAKGDGPAAVALKNKPSDLTLLARNNGGSLSGKDFEDKLAGSGMSPAHGNSEMPVWGSIFRDLPGNDKLRVFNLREYIQSLQVK
jgi:mono/diheme cytochrome c family protein